MFEVEVEVDLAPEPALVRFSVTMSALQEGEKSRAS